MNEPDPFQIIEHEDAGEHEPAEDSYDQSRTGDSRRTVEAGSTGQLVQVGFLADRLRWPSIRDPAVFRVPFAALSDGSPHRNLDLQFEVVTELLPTAAGGSGRSSGSTSDARPRDDEVGVTVGDLGPAWRAPRSASLIDQACRPRCRGRRS